MLNCACIQALIISIKNCEDDIMWILKLHSAICIGPITEHRKHYFNIFRTVRLDFRVKFPQYYKHSDVNIVKGSLIILLYCSIHPGERLIHSEL